jgi:hypothetical protein
MKFDLRFEIKLCTKSKAREEGFKFGGPQPLLLPLKDISQGL